MADIIDPPKSFLDLFKAILRYVASGVTFIIVIQILRHDLVALRYYQNNFNWTLLVFAGICGILIYAIHAAVLDDIFYSLSVWYILKRKYAKNREKFLCDEFIVKRNPLEIKPVSEIKARLTLHRDILEDTKSPAGAIAIQERLDQLLALLVLLYTTSYTLIGAPLLMTVRNLYNCSFSFSSMTFNSEYMGVFLLGVVLIWIGFRLDLKITREELFLVKDKVEKLVIFK